jgi:hypothetical protein
MPLAERSFYQTGAKINPEINATNEHEWTLMKKEFVFGGQLLANIADQEDRGAN